jgi:hypothetical protein
MDIPPWLIWPCRPSICQTGGPSERDAEIVCFPYEPTPIWSSKGLICVGVPNFVALLQALPVSWWWATMEASRLRSWIQVEASMQRSGSGNQRTEEQQWWLAGGSGTGRSAHGWVLVEEQWWIRSTWHWYISNVSIIFDAPCLFSHHLPIVSLHLVALLCIFRN